MRAGTAARVGWSACGLSIACAAAALVLAALRGSQAVSAGVELETLAPAFPAAFAIGFGLFGALIVARQPRHPIGWLFCLAGLAAGVDTLADEYAARALYLDPESLPAGEAAAWLGSWVWIGMLPLVGTVVALLFPTGRLPSRRWRPALWLAVVALAVLFVAFAFGKGDLPDLPIANPLGVVPSGIVEPLIILVGPTILVCLASLVVRFRRAQGDERQQLRWVAAATVLTIGVNIVAFLVPGEPEWMNRIRDASVVALIVAAGIAILHYRLYDLDLVVNRTLVYGALTAGIVALYVGLVTGVGELVDSTGLGVSLAATAVVAVAVQPLRQFLQTKVDRLMYGDRDDPYQALARLGERLGNALDPDAVLPGIVEAVADGLRLPYVAIELDGTDGARLGTAHGSPAGGELVRVPLSYRGERVGNLVVAPRAAGESLSAADLRLLADFARQAGIAVHAVGLTAELRRSRERLVAARAEERRRLRRDLHDGLGPMLAGIALEIESGRALVASDPGAARELLGRLQSDVKGAIADIRRIAHDLRPPALDELGLVGAIREGAARLSAPAGTNGGLAVSVDAPEMLPPLPAAVEVAAYRIALEALTNVSRHARAGSCTVRIELNDALAMKVRDDGIGLTGGRRAGVGLTSMRERAEELGGSFEVRSPRTGGTVVVARLPCAGRVDGAPAGETVGVIG